MEILRSPWVFVTSLVLLLHIVLLHTSTASRPHIVVIMADDLGWNDVGYKNPEVHTPNIDKLAEEGVKLNYSYMQQVCTPSRVAFLTGIYPFRMGLQNLVLRALENNSMPVEHRVLPERLKTLGYATHYIGKWHLGFCHYNMTPTRRGFDTFYGMYNGKGGYFNHTSKWSGYDLQDNKGTDPQNFRVAWEDYGKYSTHLFTNRAVKIIDEHDLSTPLFLFLSYQAVHGPLEVPEGYLQLCPNVVDETRKRHCAVTAAMDEGIGVVMQALRARGLSDNLITLFTTDNGGPVRLGSSNWPLRGSKITLWEGGTRAVSILHSKTHLPYAPYEWKGLIHAVDWYPTLLQAAGDKSKIADIDGVDSWKKIVRNSAKSARQGFVYNINDVKNSAAIRYNRFKLIYNKGGNPDGWYNPPGNGASEEPNGSYSEYMLFDVEKDSEERNDLSGVNKEHIVKTMAKLKKQLATFRQGLKPTTRAAVITEGKPRFHGGAWVSGWC